MGKIRELYFLQPVRNKVTGEYKSSFWKACIQKIYIISTPKRVPNDRELICDVDDFKFIVFHVPPLSGKYMNYNSSGRVRVHSGRYIKLFIYH